MKCVEIQEFSHLFEPYPLKKYKKGEYIVRQGDEVYEVGFIKNGYARLFKINSDGEEITINHFKPLFIVSFICAFLGIKSDYYMEAVTEMEVWSAPNDEIMPLLLKDKETIGLMLRKYVNLLRRVLNDVENVTRGDATKKVGQIIGSLTHDYSDKQEIPFDVSQRVIASIAGVSRETVNKIISDLESAGLIERKNKRIVIPNRDKFDSYIEG